MNVPARDLRSNLGTWAVPNIGLPSLANQLVHALPTEEFDPNFEGQRLETTYFDTPSFALRKARLKGKKYLTLRIRCYHPSNTYAASAKTESQKLRLPLAAAEAENPAWPDLLPGDLLSRLWELAGDQPLVPVVTIGFQRFAVEDDMNRFTLDIGIHTDTGKSFPSNVLEFKSIDQSARPPIDLDLRPIKLSKFLWACQ
jgi:hypothetical protein